MANEKNDQSTADRELYLSRLLSAPRDLVWEVFTKPEHISKWWGPTGFTNTIQIMEVFPGGVWEFVMHGPDGTDYKNKSVYLELSKPHRIVFDHISGPKFRVTIELLEEGLKTRLNWHMLFETKEQFEQVVKVFRADEGLKQNGEKLEQYVIGQAIVVERLLPATVARVWSALTDKDEMKNWYFDLAEFKAEPGFVFEFTGGPSPEKQYIHICEVTEVIPGRKLVYTWRYKGYEGISTVCFELFPNGAQTLLKLTHSGIDSFPESNTDFAKGNFMEGWNHIIHTALKNYLAEKN